MTIPVASFEQIAGILSKLATNYSNLFVDYFNIFFNPQPMDVTLQIFDEDGQIQTYVIPNRAKDKSFILNGTGTPEDTIVASEGSTYQDLENGELYVKRYGVGSKGWSKVISDSDLNDILVQGSGSPEGIITRPKGTLYVDQDTASLYIKGTSSGSLGWVLVSANTDALASIDLDNLSSEGERHFANPSLSNLNTIGQALVDSKENVSNKVTALDVSSTDTQYPTAKAVYNAIQTGTTPRATRDLDNLTAVGEDHFLGKPQMSGCVLHAPNGVASISGNIISIPAGMTVWGANGRNNNRNMVGLEGTTVNRTTTVTVDTPAHSRFVIFYLVDNNTIITCDTKHYYKQIAQPSIETGTVAVWYSPSKNKFSFTTGTSWEEHVALEIASFDTDLNSNPTNFSPVYPISVVTPSDLSEKIDRSGDFMTGRLEFRTDLPNFIGVYTKNSTISKSATVAPDVNLYGCRYGARDKDGNYLGNFSISHSTTNNINAYMSVERTVGSENKTAQLGVGVHADGTAYTYAPTPVTASNNTEIATTEWVHGQTDDKVKKTGDTMTGRLTQNMNIGIYQIYKMANYTTGTAPSANTYPCIEFQDKNGARVGRLEVGLESNGTRRINISMRHPTQTSSFSVLGCGYLADGTIFTSAPTPPTGDNSTKIATTAWVTSHRCTTKPTTTSTASTSAPAYVVQNYLNGTSWYRVWSDGFIEQGGSGPGGWGTITLLKKFSNIQYTITAQSVSSDGSNDNNIVYEYTQSSFKYFIEGNVGMNWRACGY